MQDRIYVFNYFLETKIRKSARIRETKTNQKKMVADVDKPKTGEQNEAKFSEICLVMLTGTCFMQRCELVGCA